MLHLYEHFLRPHRSTSATKISKVLHLQGQHNSRSWTAACTAPIEGRRPPATYPAGNRHVLGSVRSDLVQLRQRRTRRHMAAHRRSSKHQAVTIFGYTTCSPGLASSVVPSAEWVRRGRVHRMEDRGHRYQLLRTPANSCTIHVSLTCGRHQAASSVRLYKVPGSPQGIWRCPCRYARRPSCAWRW